MQSTGNSSFYPSMNSSATQSSGVFIIKNPPIVTPIPRDNQTSGSLLRIRGALPTHAQNDHTSPPSSPSLLSHVSGSVSSTSTSIHSGKSSDFAVSPRDLQDGDGGMLHLSHSGTHLAAIGGRDLDLRSDAGKAITQLAAQTPAFKNTTLHCLQALYPNASNKKETIIFFPTAVSKSEEEIQAFIERRYPDREVKRITSHDVTFKFSQKVIKYSSVKNVVVRSGVKYHHTGKKYPKRLKSEYYIKWGLNSTSKSFSSMTKYQVFNHFPGSWALGRKDSLYRHLDAMRRQHGHTEFPFVPKSWILPGQKKDLKHVMEEATKKGSKSSSNNQPMWIVKPQNSCCGRGISIVRSYEQLKKKLKASSTTGWIVQDYISNPLLLRGCKFDLRLYVCVTSYDPLRIYLYDDGLCRISTRKYTLSKDSRFVHLTNFSVHKKSKSFVKNTDSEADGEGHKWSLPALRRYFKERGIDDSKLWEDTKALIIKTILSVESKVNQMTKKSMSTKENVLFELLGFDVLIDENLNPHILEVNCGPSLSTGSPLDLKIKTNLLADIYTMVGVQPVQRKLLHKEKLAQKEGNRLEAMQASAAAKNAEHAEQPFKRTLAELMRLDHLDFLTDEDVHIVTEVEEEFSRRGQFERIFPTKNTWKQYHHLFPSVRYKNLLVHLFLSNSSSRKRALIMRKKNSSLPLARPAFVPTATFRGSGGTDSNKTDPELRKAQEKYRKVRSRYRTGRRISAPRSRKIATAGVWAMDNDDMHDASDDGTGEPHRGVIDHYRHQFPVPSGPLRKRSQSAPSRRRESLQSANAPPQTPFHVAELKFPPVVVDAPPKRAYASPRGSMLSVY